MNIRRKLNKSLILKLYRISKIISILPCSSVLQSAPKLVHFWATVYIIYYVGVHLTCTEGSGVDPSTTLGGCSRPEGPGAAVGFLGGASQPPTHQLGGLGERCKLPQWGPGRSPSRQTILPHLTGQDGLS